MATFTGEKLAEPGRTFAPDSWDRLINCGVTVSFGGGFSESGKLVAAEVADDGKSVRLTLEVPDELQKRR